jgi:phenylpropionate dioxygenase-like ring-hydroxylating dioxygenase large terminal subunit
VRADENELLTRVGPEAPMGRLMRRYWIPALKSGELAAGGAPVRLRLLGENFLAFRSPESEVGVLDHQCAHRCASLFYGRNEEGGIRCVYHGWKFARNGQCVEMPSEPPETDYKARVKIRALHVTEKYGVVWVHMSDRAPPPLPHFDWDELEEGKALSVSFMMRECNWLQALEGDIDTCHVGFLHLGAVGPETFEEGSLNYYRQLPENLAPRYEALETDYGAIYCAYRHAGPENNYHRIGQFAMPFWTMAPSEPMDYIHARAWVPIDDHHSMLVVIGGPRSTFTRDKDGQILPGAGVNIRYLPNTTDWLGRWRIEENPRNDHLIAREIQRTDSYTGIEGIPVQDQAITESMGPIVDRTKEHLGTSDRMIMLTRRKLMRAALAFRDSGAVPHQTETAESYHHVRAGFAILPRETDWLVYYNARRAEWSKGTALPIERMKPRAAPAAEKVA